jgi:hypothetical protein
MLTIIFEFAQIFKSFYHLTLSPKACSIAERCRRKREVKLSIVFETARFRIVPCVFNENAERNLVFLARTPNYINHFRRKHRVELCAFSSIQHIQRRSGNVFSANTRSETKRFHPQGRVKLCIWGENAVFAKIRLFRGILNLIYYFF